MLTEGICLQIAGHGADVAARDLETFLKTLDPDHPASVMVTNAAGDALKRQLDPVAVAALILAIPGAILAAMDIADRIEKRQRAEQIIEKAKEIEIEKSVTIRVVTKDGTKGLDQLTIDELIDLANE